MTGYESDDDPSNGSVRDIGVYDSATSTKEILISFLKNALPPPQKKNNNNKK